MRISIKKLLTLLIYSGRSSAAGLPPQVFRRKSSWLESAETAGEICGIAGLRNEGI